MDNDKKPSPEWLQDLIVQYYIQKLLYRDAVDKDKYSLDTQRNIGADLRQEVRSKQGIIKPIEPKKLKPAYKHTTELKPASIPSKELPSATKPPLVPAHKKRKKLGEQYVSQLLQKKGCDVAIMKEGCGYGLFTLNADRNKALRYEVLVEAQTDSAVIGIEVSRTDKDKNVVSNINDTFADFYMIKICGMPGVYQVATNNLRELIKENCLKTVTLSCDDCDYTIAVMDKQVLLDNAQHIQP